ncbi:hypothetical protein BURK1_02455 [Burkholderiales bacterium]|nr:hypothetical protein BURK1_02455 [Burkholderiales bacterium]
MAGSTSDAPDDAPRPTERALSSIAEQIEAIDELIDRARSTLRVFDVDLSEGGWHAADRVERLTAFLRRGRGARIELIVHDTRWLEQSCPRLVAMLRSYGHAMTVYRTGHEARNATDPLVIADDRHYLHRFHVDGPRATLAFDAPLAARPLVARFADIWATGVPGLSGTVLGL